MSKSLFNTADVKKVRESLLEEQDGKDTLTGLEIPNSQAVLDHNHNTMFVRSVLHRQANATLGKLENLWTRYLSWWYPYDLPTFLEQCAAYLRKKDDERYIHPAWLKLVKTDFNKLSTDQQKKVLKSLGQPEGKNLAERKKSFNKALLTKQHNFDTIRNLINQSKE